MSNSSSASPNKVVKSKIIINKKASKKSIRKSETSNSLNQNENRQVSSTQPARKKTRM